MELSRNFITTVHQHAFEGLEALESLGLSHNRIHSISLGDLMYCNVDLSFNQIKSLRDIQGLTTAPYDMYEFIFGSNCPEGG